MTDNNKKDSMTDNNMVLELMYSPGNPRNSEGSFVTLKDGRILFAYSRYRGNEDWADHAIADITARLSEDGGRTWSVEDRLLVANEGDCNVMSASLLRLQDGRIALFYLRKNNVCDCRLWMRTSADETETWSEPVCCIPAPGYFVVNNDRVIQLATGRLVVPASYFRTKRDVGPGQWGALDQRGIALFFLSDDAGLTWRESRDWLAFPGKCPSGLQETGVIERRDGTLYGWFRTEAGWQYETESVDGGETWTVPRPSPFRSPCSPLSIKRDPATGHLLAVWNDHSRVKEHQQTDFRSSSWGRTPLSLALSKDDGKTWLPAWDIEPDPNRGFCYIAIHFTGDAVLLGYCCGGGGRGGVLQDSCIRRIQMDLVGRHGAGAKALPAFTISQRTTQPLLKSEMPWENRYMNFFNVIRDERGWHMWYHAYDQSYKDDNDAYLCYAFSRDGVAWTRPEQGLVEYAGSKQNNILIGGRAIGGMHGGTVFLDPQAPAAERYKLVFTRGEIIDGHLVWVVYGAVSDDGLHWRILSEPLLKKNSDTQTVCFRDGDLYRLYVRMWSGSHFSGKRMVGYTESRTFGAFPAPEPILAPAPQDPDDLHFYNSAATKLRDDLYVIFSSAFFTGDQTVRPYLAVSRDGRRFERVGNREFLALGATDSFDGKSIYVVPGAVPGDKPGTWWMYYIGLNIGHDGKPDRAGAYGRFLLEVT